MLHAGNENHRIERDRLTYGLWGSGITLAQYLYREWKLRNTTYSRRAMHTWLWMTPKGETLSSCETYRMTATFRGKPAHVYGIANVFTVEALRGKGHASDMLKSLLRHLPTLDGQAKAAILYSEIGEGLYSKLGFSKVVSEDWVWDTAPLEHFPEGVQVLKEQQLHQAAPKHLLGTLQVLPTAEQIDWQLERERIYAEQFQLQRPLVHGAVVPDGRATWRAQFRTQELGFLTFEAATVEAAHALVQSARKVAFDLGLKAVRWWKTPLEFDWEAPPEARVESREDRDLPMIYPLTPEVSPEDWNTVHRAVWV